MASRRQRTAPANYERQLWAAGVRFVAGVDEAGRGAWAGPVVAAAVIMPPEPRIPGVVDSKALTPKQREELYEQITSVAVAWAVASAEPEEIEALNILGATRKAMCEAVARLSPTPERVLIDGNDVPELALEHTAIPDGDSRCYSIAAASIIAKVWRDRLMIELDAKYPGYDFARHKGYGTKAHQQALAQNGPCPIHRMCFEPVKRLAQRRLRIAR